MKKKKTVAVIAVLAIACIVIFLIWWLLFAPTALTREINKVVDFKKHFSIISIEEMEADHQPINVELSTDYEGYSDLLSLVESLQVRYIRTEVGMELTSPLYTFTVTSDDMDDLVSITVNDSNQLHINQNDKTYSIITSDLYSILKSTFKEISDGQ